MFEPNFYDVINYVVENYGNAINNKNNNKTTYEYISNNIKITKTYLTNNNSFIRIYERKYDDDYWREAKITPKFQKYIIDNIYNPIKNKEKEDEQKKLINEKKIENMRRAAIDSSYIFNIIKNLGYYEDDNIKVEEIYDKYYDNNHGYITYVKERRVTLKKNNNIVYSIDNNGIHAYKYLEGNWEKYLINIYENSTKIINMVSQTDYIMSKERKKKTIIKKFEFSRYCQLNPKDDI